MKLSSLLLLSAAAFSSLSAPAIAEDLYSWDFSEANEARPGFVDVPDTVLDNTLTFPAGAKLVADPEVRGGKAVAFDGSQTEAARTAKTIPPQSAVLIKMRCKPSTEAGESAQTIMSLNATYELRYLKDRRLIEFIVLYPPKRYFQVRAPIVPGEWNQVLASYQDGKLSLVVGLVSKEGMMPADAVTNPQPAHMRVGLVGDRAFVGSIAELTVGTP